MQGEVFKDTKERLSIRLGLKGKQFDKIKFAIVPRSIYAKPSPLNDGILFYKPLPFGLMQDTITDTCAEDVVWDVIRSNEDQIGLDHVNRHRSLGDSIFIR